MLNTSKLRDPRFWRRWLKSGALGRLAELPQPRDINAGRHFWNSFDNREREISAGWIVELCQRNGSWRPFTLDELQAFYSKTHNENFWFNGLDHLGYVVLGEDGLYRVTAEFVRRCYKSSPAASR